MSLAASIKLQKLTLLDVVVGQCAAVLELLSSKDQSLLVRGDACRVGCSQWKSLKPV